ncbi:hypothetical protein H0H93_009237 [Arthromyces matolae]|nr:hypothetical protein H0H93_009237 [Arthromyces matolae]
MSSANGKQSNTCAGIPQRTYQALVNDLAELRTDTTFDKKFQTIPVVNRPHEAVTRDLMRLREGIEAYQNPRYPPTQRTIVTAEGWPPAPPIINGSPFTDYTDMQTVSDIDVFNNIVTMVSAWIQIEEQ